MIVSNIYIRLLVTHTKNKPFKSSQFRNTNLLLQLLPLKGNVLSAPGASYRTDCCRGPQSRWPELALDAQLMTQSPSAQQASHCKAARDSADVKSPLVPRADCSHEACPTHPAAGRDGARPADGAATATATSPHHMILGSSQRLAQSTIQGLPLTDAHLACRWTEKKKKAPQCFATLAWESLGILAYLPASTRAEKQIRKLPMVSFSLRNGPNGSLWVNPSMHKSQEIQDCHSHSLRRPSTHR